MNSDSESASTITANLETYLFGHVLSDVTTWGFLLIGGIITVYSLLNIELLQSGGARGYTLVFSGVSAFLWSVSELLPQQYRKAIGALRITVVACLGIVVVSLIFISIFWWGMN